MEVRQPHEDTTEVHIGSASASGEIIVIVENVVGTDYRLVEINVNDPKDPVRIREITRYTEQFIVEEQLGA